MLVDTYQDSYSHDDTGEARRIGRPPNTTRDKEIRRLISSGSATPREVADRYGITRSRVYQIVNADDVSEARDNSAASLHDNLGRYIGEAARKFQDMDRRIARLEARRRRWWWPFGPEVR